MYLRKEDPVRKFAAALGRRPAAGALLFSLLVTAGCHRDPNKQKQKYLESGKRYAAEGKYKEAAIQFSNALKVDRNFGEAHYQLGSTYIKMGSVMPGYAELQRAVALQPGNLPARIDLGNLLLAGHQVDRANEQAQAVLAADSRNADAHALLSSIAAYQNNRAEAVSRSTRHSPLTPIAHSFTPRLD